MTRNEISADVGNATIVESSKRKLEDSSRAPTDPEPNDFFGGGAVVFPFGSSAFSLIRLFKERDE